MVTQYMQSCDAFLVTGQNHWILLTPVQQHNQLATTHTGVYYILNCKVLVLKRNAMLYYVFYPHIIAEVRMLELRD